MIEIKYNRIYEIKSWLEVLLNKRWLDRQGYFYYLNCKKKYRKTDFQKLSHDLVQELIQYTRCFSKKIKYKVFLSRYGTFGSYYLPDKIIVNVQRNVKEIAKTIIHEIIHLNLEDELRKQGLSHQQKEKNIESEFKKRLQNSRKLKR